MSVGRRVSVLICFYSRYGNTAKLAEAIADGVRITPMDAAWVRRVPDLAPENVIRQDARWWKTRESLRAQYPVPQAVELARADALVLGSPGYFGGPAAALKHWLETGLGGIWRGEELEEKVGAAFCCTGTDHGGNELTVTSLLTTLMNLGCVICPTGYLFPTLHRNQMPYGASAVTGPNDEIPPTPEDIAAARALGFRVAHVARMLAAGHGREEFRRHFPEWRPPKG